jgi:GntR family transcriptional repressor for pyruvate dehydrogenase complex
MAEPSEAEEPLFEPVGRSRLFERVLGQLEHRIRQGRLQAGDKLPSERALSATLQVSRQSVREALRVLEAMDIIRVRTGIGGAGGSVISGEFGPTISRLMRLYMALGHFDIDDMVSLRELLEASAVRTATIRRTDQQLASLAALIDEMESVKDEPEKFLRADARFHLTVATAGGNRLRTHMMGSMRDAITEQLLTMIRALDWARLADSLQADHRQLLEALVVKDVESATQATNHHSLFYADIRRA